MARRRHYRKPRQGKYKKPAQRRGRAKTEEAKARSIQVSWRRATNRTESISIEQARAIVAKPPVCQYCDKPILWFELSIDHKLPRSRGGPDASENLVWTDFTCNTQKGDLTDKEYRALLDFLKDWPQMRESVLGRLRVAGAVYGRKRRFRRS